MASSSMALRRLASGILRPRGGITRSTFAPAATRSSSSTNLALGSRQFSTSSFTTMARGRGRKISNFEQVKFEGNQFVAYTTPSRGTGTTGEMKEDKDGLQLKVNMPGLGKENVKVFIEDNELVIVGKQGTDKMDGDDHIHTLYSGNVLLTPKSYSAQGIKAEMKHGQLNVTIPRRPEETDVPAFVKVV